MGLKNLKILWEKERRVYLILGILLLLASIFVQFEVTFSRGIELYLWTTDTCIIYYGFTFILRDKISKYNYVILPLSFMLSYPFSFYLSFAKVGDIQIGFIITSILVLFGMYYWFTITALFTVTKLFKISTDLDLKIEKFSKSVNYSMRGAIFIGGALISTILLFVTSELILDYDFHSASLRFIIWPLNFFMILYIWFFFIIGCVALVFKKMYFWFGPLFILCSFYAIYIMLQAARGEYFSGSTSSIPALRWVLFLVSSFLLLSTISDLIGEKSKILVKKMKFIKPESMIIGLIFSMGMVEYGSVIVPQEQTALQLNFMSDFFPIFVGIFGIYAIYSFNKKMRKKKEPVQLAEVLISEKPKILGDQKQISKEIINPLLCPKCGKANSPDSMYCVYCSSILITKEIESFREEKGVTQDKIEETSPFKEQPNLITKENAEPKPLFCSTCGKANSPDSKYCVFCSSVLFKEEKGGIENIFCSICGRANTPDSKHCVYCGAKLQLP